MPIDPSQITGVRRQTLNTFWIYCGDTTIKEKWKHKISSFFANAIFND